MSAVRPSHPAPETERRDLLRRLATTTADVVGDPFFRALVRQLAEAFTAELAFIAERLPATEGRMRVLASWTSGPDLPAGHEFDLDDAMPCSVVDREGVLVVAEGTCARFPHDRVVAGYGLDAYVGLGLPGSDGDGPVGYLAVMARGPLHLDADEIAVLRIFAARAAAEVERRRHAATLRARDAEIAAARARVLEAADLERQRIGRDLHDGAQQRIVALGHLIGLARRQLGDDAPSGPTGLLDRAHEEARLATDELRELARGLHPAGLTEKGLGPALEALAGRAPEQVSVRITRLPERRLPAPIELTAYYLAAEALTNAVRHADASALTVAVHQRPDVAEIVIADDGRGGADEHGGSGLRGLRDRVAALGGALRIDSPPGHGTRLEATVPVAPWRSAHEPFLEFGHPDDDGRGERSIQRLIDGEKTASVTLAREWELEGGIPPIGQHLPVIDHEGRRRATVEVGRVAVLPFTEIGPDVIAATATGEPTPEAWRRAQHAFYDACRDELALLFGEPGWRFTDEEPMVVTWYRPVAGGPPGE